MIYWFIYKWYSWDGVQKTVVIFVMIVFVVQFLQGLLYICDIQKSLHKLSCRQHYICGISWMLEWWIKNVRACKVCHEHALLKKQREAMAVTNTPQHCIHLTYRDHHIHLTYTRYSQHNLDVVIIAYILYTSPPWSLCTFDIQTWSVTI